MTRSRLDREVQHEVTLNLQVAGWVAPDIRFRDPLKKTAHPFELEPPEFFPFNDYSTINMAKKSRPSWKKDRIIQSGDSVMVGGLPTDIVIPCDSIHQIFISILTNSVLWAQPELEKALYVHRDLESLFSLTTLLVHKHSPRERCHARRP